MSTQPPRPAPSPERILRNIFLDRDGYKHGPSGSCHGFVSTTPVEIGVSGNGVLFAIKSGGEPLAITSFGFHVNPPDVTEGGAVDYEVHALKYDGYYAHPERSEGVTGMISPVVAASDSYDYRWDANAWSPIANGSIVEADLTNSTTILKSTEADFFVIPPGTFTVEVPGNGGIKSFFIAARQRTSQAGSFIYADPAKDANIYDELELTVGKDDKHGPEILVGEGITAWPLPTTDLMYQMKSFVGKVYYEEACPSASPSLSTTPSAAPTVAASGGPSVSPTATATSSEPSIGPSRAPSLLPSQAPSVHIEPLLHGLLASLDMACNPGDRLSEEEGVHMSETVRSFVDAAKNCFTRNVQVETTDMTCVSFPERRRLLANHTRADSDLVAWHRNLPKSSSAMDFSLVIRGEYRPMSRPGQTPPRKPPDLGIVAEDSINRDPEGFIKDLQDRASLRSPLQQVEASDLQVRAVEVGAVRPNQVFTREPTPSPTVHEEDSADAVLLACIVVTSGIIVLLAAFLIFRCGQRRAARALREDAVRFQEGQQKQQQQDAAKQQQQQAAAQFNRHYQQQQKRQAAAQQQQQQHAGFDAFGHQQQGNATFVSFESTQQESDEENLS